MTESQVHGEIPLDYRELDRPRDGHISRLTLPYNRFSIIASRNPSKIALRAGEESYSYQDVLDMTDRIASGLSALGLRAGEAAAIILEDRWEHIPLFLALARIGGVHITINIAKPDEHVREELEEIRPRLIIGRGGIGIDTILASGGVTPPPFFADEDAPLAIRYSSGTTGQPKKTVASQKTQSLVYNELASVLQITSDDVHMAMGSLAHVALQTVLMQLMVGGSVVVHSFNPKTLWEDVERLGVTNLMMMPAMIGMAMDSPGELSRPITLTSMGAALAPPLKEKLAKRFPSIHLYDVYASTELSFLTALRPSEQTLHPTSAGRAVFSTEVGLFDDEGAPVPVGETGQIYGRGPMTISSFFGTARAKEPPTALLDAGWIRSGDLGHFDKEGFLYIHDREADLIRLDGEIIFPSIIENILKACPDVREAAVVGVPDENGQVHLLAYVEGDADPRALEEALADHISGKTRPEAVHVIDALPRTTSAKISRHLLRQKLAKPNVAS